MVRRRDDGEGPGAYHRALGLLVRREHSRRELERKLAAKGEEPAAAAEAVAELSRQGYQDDARFAEMLVRSRVHGGHGPVRVRAELAQHGIPRDTGEAAIAEVLEALGLDWPDLARDLVQRRFPRGCPDLATRRKAADLLARRGFESAQLQAALRDAPDADLDPA
jgi:regulatory protein